MGPLAFVALAVLAEAVMKHVLVVDDESDVKALVCQILEDTGYSVDGADDGREALRKIEATHPDLVVLDLMMPMLDGWSVLRHVMGAPHPPPIVVLSAHVDGHLALRAGATAFVRKPFDLDELIATCRGALLAA